MNKQPLSSKLTLFYRRHNYLIHEISDMAKSARNFVRHPLTTMRHSSVHSRQVVAGGAIAAGTLFAGIGGGSYAFSKLSNTECNRPAISSPLDRAICHQVKSDQHTALASLEIGIGVIVVGGVSYGAASAAEKRKNKPQSRPDTQRESVGGHPDPTVAKSHAHTPRVPTRGIFRHR